MTQTDRERRREPFRRGLGSPALFAIVYTSVASAVYFSLGVIAEHALGLTPLVFLAAGVFFLLAAMTYIEGSSLHQDRAGSTVFARFAFNELVSFVAGWAILLDYIILIAVTALSATHYLAAFWSPLGDEDELELLVSIAIILYVAVRNVRGFSKTRVNRIAALVVADLALQVLLIVLGLVAFFDLDVLLDPIELGTNPEWSEVVFALGVATVVFTGLESAAGLSGEVAVGRAGLKRLMTARDGDGDDRLRRHRAGGDDRPARRSATTRRWRATTSRRPCSGSRPASTRTGWPTGCTYVVAVAAAMTLIAAANSAMLGLSRLAYSLATNRQIPSWIGRLHPTRSTPFVVIGMAALLAAALVRAARRGVPGRHVRLRGAHRADHRAPVDRRLARARADAAAAVHDAGQRDGPRGVDPAARGGRRDLRRAVLGGRRRDARRRTRRGLRVAGRRAAPVRRLPHDAGQVAGAPGRRAGRRAAARARPPRRAAVRLDPRPASSAPRWTTTSCRPPGGSPPRRTRTPTPPTGERRSRRSGCSRSRCRCPSTPRCPRSRSAAPAPRCRAPRRWGRSTRAWRSPRRPSARGARAPRSWRRRAGAACRRSCWPRRSRPASAGAPCSAGAEARRENFVGDATKHVVAKSPCQVILTAPPASAMPAMAPPAGVGDRATPGAPGR